MARRAPHTVRLRLSLAYALLFLLAGATLLALTYGLVASSLPNASSPLTSVQATKLVLACKQARVQAESGAGVPVQVGKQDNAKPVPGVAKAVPAACRRAFTAGANATAASQRDQTLRNLLLFSLLGLGAMTVISGALGWLMAGRALRPVAAITGAARRASERHLGERLALVGPRDELKELADTFDDMLDRLDAAFASQRRFVADASHELRTPLTVMRTAIDVTLAKPVRSPDQLEAMAKKVRRSVDQAEMLIGALLTLAMSDRDVAQRESIDLATAAEDALDGAEAAIAASQLRVSTDLEPAETSGDRMLLDRMVANVVDNAVRYNRPGGTVEVRTWTDDVHAWVEVANSGPLVPDDEVVSLFEPFRRREVRTNVHDGAGLGLAIVNSISVAHAGLVEARARPEGGLVICLAVPRSGVTEPEPARS